MIKNIFKKLKRNFSNKNEENNQNLVIQDSSINKENLLINKNPRIFEFEGKKFNLNLLEKKTQRIIILYGLSISKIKFFENLLSNLKIERNSQITNLKTKLKKENSIN
tara:strand:+ start:3378 stop:3701 length:324 start_codon:yes stop_codon:yes gene_type:complete